MTEITKLWESVQFAVGSYAWSRRRVSKKSEHIITRVNDLANRRGNLIRVHRVASRAPVVTVTGKATLHPVAMDLAAAIRPTLELNEVHAMALHWTGSEIDEIFAETCDFGDVMALRKLSSQLGMPRPAVISAGAVLVCPAERSILLQRRSIMSATHPGVMHILGGAFKPSVQLGSFDSSGDRTSLEFTMLREVFEEGGVIVSSYNEPICVAEELDTGFIQYVYLGVRITTEQFSQVLQNSEGKLEKVSYDDLEKWLSNERDWVPTGRAQVLMWLGIGAPGAGWNAKFNGKTARKLFDSIGH